MLLSSMKIQFLSARMSDQFSIVFSDIVMHSATKFIAGHSDLMAGVLAIKGERLITFVTIRKSHFLWN